jgi:hypothetical protein
MRIGKIYQVFILLALSILFQSRSGGPGTEQNLQVTGAPGSTGSPGTCANAGCHDDNQFNPSVKFLLIDGADTIDTYEPGKTYKLQVISVATNAVRHGFQAVSLNEADQQAGDWGAPGAGKKVKSLSGRKYIEHSAGSASPVFEMPWIAPASGTGPVTIYAATAAVNNNGNANGDGTASGSLRLEEKNTTSVSAAVAPFSGLAITPNPVKDWFSIQMTIRTGGSYELRIADMRGTVNRAIPLSLQAGIRREEIAVGDLAPGLYFVHLTGAGYTAAARMLKL